MLNMLKMDLRRIIKSKSFYITVIIFLIYTSYCIFFQTDFQTSQSLPSAASYQNEFGLYTAVDYYLNTPVAFMYIFAFKNALLIFGIFIVLFVCSEYSSGFIKNSCMMYKNRRYIILNKLFVTTLLSLFITFLSFLLCTVLGFLLIKDFKFDAINDLLIYSGTSSLFFIALFSLLIFLCTLTRSKTVGIIFSTLLPVGLTMVITEPLFNLMHLNDLGQYTISQLVLTLPMKFNDLLSTRVIIMSVIYILLYNGLGMKILNKKDI